jgi:hypothetical protein
MSPQLELSSFLDAIRRRWRLLVGLRAATMAVSGISLVLAAVAALYWSARPSADVLLAAAALAVAAIVAWTVRALRPALHLPDDRRLARYVEERHPAFNDALAAAVQAREHDTGFARAVMADAAMQARSVSPASIVRGEDLSQAMRRGLAACALLLVTGGASFEPFDRALDAGRVRLFPSSVAISVQPGDVRLLAGHSLTLRATISGLPRDFDAAPVVAFRGDPSVSRDEPMTTDGNGFRLDIRSVDASFVYDVRVAGVRSREYRVTVLRSPTIRQIDVSYDYPSYTGIPARVEEDGGDIYAPAGTRVTVRVRADKPLRSGTLRLGRRALPLGGTGDERLREATFVVERDGSYRVALTDTDGLQSDQSSEYFVRVTDDRPPEVRILRPETDRAVTPLEEVQIAAAAQDDYRLSALELVYAVGSHPEQVVSLSRSAAPSLAGGHLLYLEELDVQPGDVVRAYARAREAKDRGARQAVSEMLLLTVTPFDQEFSMAQSQSGGGTASDRDLESLIQGQKNVVNATWNLLRREAAGRSAEDVKTLSAAQRELKQRAAAMSGRERPRGAASGSNALARAAEAMGRAEEALRRSRLQDAVPHEMQALTELTRAEAENRQRQIRQQRSSGGGGGGGRSNLDLSALFDRELLRQQQTNYEDRENPSGSSSGTERESDLQKRLQELARRQAELARQQRDLAARGMSEEERRRQLERLTREQEELRREAEQLAREMSGEGGQSGQQQEQAENLREAAEDMREASGEMRRNNPQSASERSGRAAERLRQAERNGSTGRSSGARSAGELQMEAQQLADAQRRLESEQQSEQRESSGGNRDDAGRRTAERQARRQRLAETQEQLAERADRLERDARSLAGGTGHERQRQAASQAARDLQRERVAERMRENAQALRRDGRGAAGEQQATAADPQRPQNSGKGENREKGESGDGGVSSTLDRVAERLGASADAETRRLADELEKSRAAREQLQQMEHRLERATREGDEARGRELSRETARAEEMLRELERGLPENGSGGTTPEEHEYSRSAPGMESFKQDFARWEQLRRNIELALERRDLEIAERLRGDRGKDPLAAGSVPSIPPSYRDKVARYFELIAREGGRP